MLKTLSLQFIIIYFILINLITFITFGIDKGKAINNNRRVSEKTLWIMSLIGGSLGALLGMKMFRHKTKKLSFQAMMAVILMLQIFIIYLILK
ncbi:MAG: DUF1294 domain-containing protein [Candidatus Magasanikbacteria bacterium CG_4_10_14_0_2_um_filter_33_14]|uniref:DUF1294 domain-containing protein n=1 Tax=Candidatus Magasanikbacteria bacterium CG_4_10_14_0_2_um_filter_33_14 TaxID=1974636 RepID=A0A2M7VA62_9BACT|nr:MAG: DUF1294 domain-containing protein [Candidatus Magasanikbacteria bacterium CG_4_10_14_0_2_um_filter_33_14]